MDKADLYYEVRGEGEPLVFLHGMPTDSRMWEPQMEALSARYQVIRFDYRGVGQSTHPGGTYSIYEDIHSLLSHLHIEKAHFIGLSFGSYVGVEFALAYPDKVNQLILACPGGFLPPSEDRQQFHQRFEDMLSTGNTEQAADIMVDYYLDGYAQEHGRVQTNRPWFTELNLKIYSHPLNLTMPTWLEPNPRERTSDVQAPTLVVSGLLDHPDFLKAAELLTNTIPDVRRLELPDSAHFPNIDSPDTFNQIIMDFLR